jgi:hypothetical protein
LGLVDSEALAELVVNAALSQTGYKRYEKLLAGTFLEIAKTEITSLIRIKGAPPLLCEASALQEQRNSVVHRGEDISARNAEEAVNIATAVYDPILSTVLLNLGLSVKRGGRLVDDQP